MTNRLTSTPTAQHPDDVLFADEVSLPALPAVDHYAGTPERIAKALQLQAKMGPLFDITCDCEDGAPVGQEREHAERLAQLIAGADNSFGRVGARIHDVRHPAWKDELRILLRGAQQRLAYITLPKAACADDVAEQIAVLREMEQQCRHELSSPHAATPAALPVHVLIETHGALHDVWAIAALPGVESLDFGLMDFVSAHQGAIPLAAMHSPLQFTHPLVARAKSEISAAALAHGCIPSHNVSTELNNLQAVAEDARLAQENFGFLRMWSIHPSQIPVILSAFTPGHAAVQEASDVLAAAQDAHWGPVRHGNRLHDRASYRALWNVLKRARQLRQTLPNDALARFFPTPLELVHTSPDEVSPPVA